MVALPDAGSKACPMQHWPRKQCMKQSLQTVMRRMPAAYGIVILRILLSERRRSLGKVGRVVSGRRSLEEEILGASGISDPPVPAWPSLLRMAFDTTQCEGLSSYAF
jgi:hypothetical protein